MEYQGASPRELVLEAARRNNTDLLHEVFTDIQKSYSSSADDRIAELLNTAVDGIGSNVLHVAATNGSCKYDSAQSYYWELRRNIQSSKN